MASHISLGAGEMVSSGQHQARARTGIPVWLKTLLTLWVAVLSFDHWRDTPLGFLWFCNVAVVLTTIVLWFEHRLLLSMQAVAIVWWGLLWVVDLLIHLVTGIRVTPIPLGMANYMFDSQLSIFSRALSLYHVWLPFVLLWSVKRLGYDRRALPGQTLLSWALLLLSYALTTDIHGPAGNLNLVYGLSGTEAQQWMAPQVWLVVVMLFCPVCWYVPTHFILNRLFPSPQPVIVPIAA